MTLTKSSTAHVHWIILSAFLPQANCGSSILHKWGAFEWLGDGVVPLFSLRVCCSWIPVCVGEPFKICFYPYLPYRTFKKVYGPVMYQQNKGPVCVTCFSDCLCVYWALPWRSGAASEVLLKVAQQCSLSHHSAGEVPVRFISIPAHRLPSNTIEVLHSL